MNTVRYNSKLIVENCDFSIVPDRTKVFLLIQNQTITIRLHVNIKRLIFLP